MLKARPTPWRFNNGYLLDVNGERVFEIPFFRAEPKERETFLICAVNAHDALVSSLEEAVKLLQVVKRHLPAWNEGDEGTVESAQAALYLAQKKETW